MADSQDPLATLQRLLENQKTPAEGAMSTQTAEILKQTPVGTPIEQTSESTHATDSTPALTAEEIALLEKNKEAEDQNKIAEELDKMRTEIKNSPPYQQRLAQKQAAEALSKAKELEERSRRIIQIKHLDP
jgi:hypothetical protein